MSVPPESIEIGRCYLDARYRVLHVTHVTPDGRVRFKYQEAHPAMVDAWWAGMLSLREFAFEAVREVPCDWTPEGIGENATNRQGYRLGWRPDLLPYNSVSHLFRQPGSKPMIGDAFRAYMEITRALSTDNEGREVLVGLSVEETRDYLEMLDRKSENITKDERFAALHKKHELARLAVISTEIDLSSYVREPQATGPQSQEDAFQLPPDQSKR